MRYYVVYPDHPTTFVRTSTMANIMARNNQGHVIRSDVRGDAIVADYRVDRGES